MVTMSDAAAGRYVCPLCDHRVIYGSSRAGDAADLMADHLATCLNQTPHQLTPKEHT